MPAEFLSGRNNVSPAFYDYCQPLVGGLPEFGGEWPAAILGPLFLASPIRASGSPVWTTPMLLLGSVAGGIAASASPGASWTTCRS